METQRLNVPTCDCHMLDFLSEHRKYSVTYDKERNAYFIDGFPMAYCFICGGSLPKWEPPVNEQPAPLADEEREARELVARCNSFQEVLSVLGAPDCLQYPTDDDDQTEWRRVSRVLAERQPECFANSEDTEWTRSAWYTRRWPSLCLEVFEYPDGHIDFSIMGLAPGQFVILPKASWTHWLRRQIARVTKR